MLIIDASANLSYAQVVYPSNAANGTAPAINVAGYVGKLALVISTGTVSGTTPAYTGYLQTGPNANGANAVNVNFTLPTGGNAVVATTFTASTTNTSTVIGVDQRLLNNYLFVVDAIAGTNTPVVPLSIVLVGQKVVENS